MRTFDQFLYKSTLSLSLSPAARVVHTAFPSDATLGFREQHGSGGAPSQAAGPTPAGGYCDILRYRLNKSNTSCHVMQMPPDPPVHTEPQEKGIHHGEHGQADQSPLCRRTAHLGGILFLTLMCDSRCLCPHRP